MTNGAGSIRVVKLFFSLEDGPLRPTLPCKLVLLGLKRKPFLSVNDDCSFTKKYVEIAKKLCCISSFHEEMKHNMKNANMLSTFFIIKN